MFFKMKTRIKFLVFIWRYPDKWIRPFAKSGYQLCDGFVWDETIPPNNTLSVQIAENKGKLD